MKRLILCCDGTWSSADQRSDTTPCPTNVVNVAFRTAKHDGDTLQVTWYDQGVGTGNVLDRAAGGAFGAGLDENIHDAYRFLIANYELGDELFFFGFSRGAFTVRSLAGMIRKCGILRRDAVASYHETLALYRSVQPSTVELASARFRERCSIAGNCTIPIRFIGVWDTVGALGVPLYAGREQQFHDTELSGSVESAYQALAIDEHRAAFRPALWRYQPKQGQTVAQLWFAGCHSDVGGGYVERGLSDGPLQWLMERAHACGLAFDEAACAEYPVRPDPAGEIHESRRGLFRLAGGMEREIGLSNSLTGDGVTTELDPTQQLHASVLARWDAVPRYRPGNVVRFLERNHI